MNLCLLAPVKVVAQYFLFQLELCNDGGINVDNINNDVCKVIRMLELGAELK